MNGYAKFFMLPTLVIASLATSAQSKLNYSTSTNFKLKPHFIATTPPNSVGSKGGNKVWNFGKAIQTGGWTQGYYHCATQTCSCPSGYEFETVISPNDGCFKFKQDGVYRRTRVLAKDTDIIFLPFAFSYGDQTVFKYRRQQRSTPAPVTDGIGVDSTIGYAWGSITTPLQGPTSALLVKRTVSTSDTGLVDPFNSGVPYQAVIHSRTVQYVWHSLTDGSYLFVVDSAFTMQVPGNGVWNLTGANAGFQSMTESVGIDDQLTTRDQLICYPNPASDYLNVIIPESVRGNSDCELLLRNAIGQVIAKVGHAELREPKPAVKIFTHTFPRGIYTLHLVSPEMQTIRKIVLK